VDPIGFLAVEILSSRVLLAPNDFDRSVRWYRDTLGLRVFREFGAGGEVSGVVFFLGGAGLELSRSGARPTELGKGLVLWLQVPDVDEEHARLAEAGVTVRRAPATMPWGLREAWIEDPDGIGICLVEVPVTHPLRRRLD
jgi:catechol 2,3-dioxygenase-like lactoylglutathione lyase family enzyme